MSSIYKNRKSQVMAFAKEVNTGKTKLSHALRDACMVGAAEERQRCLRIIKGKTRIAKFLRGELCREIESQSVLKVLGYEKPQ